MAKSNLTKEIAKRVKQTTCPIMEELQEQYQQTQFYKSMAKFREQAEQQFANRSLTISK
jgi:hypothetical protein